MKKLISIFIVFISFFIFHVSFVEKSENEFYTSNTFTTAMTEEGDYLFGYAEISTTLGDKQYYFDEIIDFAMINGITVCFHETQSLNDYVTENTNYIYAANSSELMHSLYTTTSGEYFDFDSNNDFYYTTDLTDENSDYYISYLDQSYNEDYNGISIFKSYDQFTGTNSWNNSTSIYMTFYVNDEEAFYKTFNSHQISSFNWDYVIVNDKSTDIVETDLNISIRTLLLVGLSLFLLAYSYVLSKRKEIVLRKMHGEQTGEIFMNLFIRDLCCIVLIYVIIQIVAYQVYIGNFYENSLEFTKIQGLYFLELVFVLFIIGIILYCVIHNIKAVTHLKKESSNKHIVYLNILLKLGAIMLLMQPMIKQVENIIPDTRLFTFLYSNKEEIEDSVYFYGTSIDTNEHDYSSAMDLALNFFNEEGATFMDMSSYELTNETDADIEFLTMAGFQFTSYPYIEVNTAYLMDYQIYDEENNLIDISSLSDETLLVPITYKEEDMSIWDASEIIYIQEDMKYYNNTYPLSASQIYIENAVVILRTSIPIDNQFINGNTAFSYRINDQEAYDKLTQFLEDNNLEEIVILKNYKNEFQVYYNFIKENIVDAWLIILIHVIASMIVVFSMIYVMIYEQRKKYAIQYIVGDTFIERYGSLYQFHAIVYGLAISFGVFTQQGSISEVMIYMVMVMLFESVISYFLIRFFERKGTTALLKGE